MRNLSQIEMAKRFGVAQGSYSGWENGAEPDYGTLVKIAKFFRVSLDDLLTKDLTKVKRSTKSAQRKLDFDNLNQKVENLIKVVEALAGRAGVDIEELKVQNEL